MKKLFSATNGVMLLLFVYAASLQFNDPDPVQWVAIYTAGAVACGLSFTRWQNRKIPLLIGIVALLWMTTRIQSGLSVPVGRLFEHWHMVDVTVEEAREMYGLLIVTVWMSVLALKN